jgi:hypothetical protein
MPPAAYRQCTASGDLVTFTLERDAFIHAASGDPQSLRAADAVLAERWGSDAPAT